MCARLKRSSPHEKFSTKYSRVPQTYLQQIKNNNVTLRRDTGDRMSVKIRRQGNEKRDTPRELPFGSF